MTRTHERARYAFRESWRIWSMRNTARTWRVSDSSFPLSLKQPSKPSFWKSRATALSDV